MKKDDVIDVTMERVPLGINVFCKDEGVQKKLLYAYHSEGWHIASARKRAVHGVFYENRHMSDILEIICPEEWMVNKFRTAIDEDGLLVIRLRAELAFPLLGLKEFHLTLK